MLSIFGSGSAMLSALRSRQWKKWTPHTRLLVGLSSCDTVLSVTLGLSSFLLPQETSRRVWAIGNDASCAALGALSQFSHSTSFCNAMLSFYFLLTARFGFKNEEIARRTEPWMHLLSLGFPLVTAIVGATMGLYHELTFGQGCWTTACPENCGDGPEGTGAPCRDPLLVMMFGGMPIIGSFLCIVFNNLIVFLFVRRQTKPQRARRKRDEIERKMTKLQPKAAHNGESVVLANSSTKQQEEGGAGADSNSVSSQLEVLSDSITSDRSLTVEEEGGYSRELDDSSRARRHQLKRLQLIASQAFLCVGAILICSVWTGCLRVLEIATSKIAQDEADLHALLVPQAWFLPLQGLFNMFVFIRPKHWKIRRDFPDQPRLWALHRAPHGNAKSLPPSGNRKPFVNQQHSTRRNNDGLMRDEGPKTSSTNLPVTDKVEEEDQNSLPTSSQENHQLEAEAYFCPPRNELTPGNISSLTASQGDFDESGFEQASEDPLVSSSRRWEANSSPCTPLGRAQRPTSSSSLEMISELTEHAMVGKSPAVMTDSTSSNSSGVFTKDPEEGTVHSAPPILQSQVFPSVLKNDAEDSSSVRSEPQERKKVRFDEPASQRLGVKRHWSAGGAGSFGAQQNVTRAAPLNADKKWMPLCPGTSRFSAEHLPSQLNQICAPKLTTVPCAADLPMQLPKRRVSPSNSECEEIGDDA